MARGFRTHREPFTVQVSCNSCSGMGYRTCNSCSGRGYRTCTSCSGTGRARTALVGLESCSFCSGKGRDECFFCNGKGRNECFFCHGSGRQDRTEWREVPSPADDWPVIGLTHTVSPMDYSSPIITPPPDMTFSGGVRTTAPSWSTKFQPPASGATASSLPGAADTLVVPLVAMGAAAVVVTMVYFGFTQAFVAAEVFCAVFLFTILQVGRWGTRSAGLIESSRQAAVFSLGVLAAALATHYVLTTPEGRQLNATILANQRMALISVVIAATAPSILDLVLHHLVGWLRP